MYKRQPLTEDVSLLKIATRTPGFSGADLANLLNEAGILAARYNKSVISTKELFEAADRIIGGIPGSSIDENINKRLLAYHEAGRAITGSVLISHDEIEKVTIKPRGKSKSLTWFTPSQDQTLVSRSTLLARIVSTLASRAAERVVFGATDITTGVSNDIQQVTILARQIVTSFGMSKIGPIALDGGNSQELALGGAGSQPVQYSKELTQRINQEVSDIINYCEQKAIQIILDNRVILDIIVEKLMEVETLDGEEFRELLSEYTVLPDKNIPYVSMFKR